MIGKVDRVDIKRHEISVEGRIYTVYPKAWEYAQHLKDGNIIDFEPQTVNGIALINFFKRVGQSGAYVKPEFRQKGRLYSDKNEDWILRENVLRTAVQFFEARKDTPTIEQVFSIAKMMEQKIKEGF